jgi:hypothetical protein
MKVRNDVAREVKRMTVKEGLLEEINLHCEAITSLLSHQDWPSDVPAIVGTKLEAISAIARELVDAKEEPVGEKRVQVCVLFKNKYLMAAKAKRSDAMDVGVLWRMYRENPGKETDAFITIGCDEEMLMFSLSSVDAIKVLFSQKDVGL